MGGQKTSTTSKVPKEIRERGSTITNAAMGTYFDPKDTYTPYNYGQHYQTGADLTGQLNNYHAASGAQINNSASNYQPYYNAAAGVTGTALNSFVAPTFQANPYVNNASNFSSINPNAGTAVAAGGGGARTADNVNPITGEYYDGSQWLVNGPDFSGEAVEKFMNPYTQNVIDQGVRQIGDAMTQKRLEDQSRAAQAGAFGGTRHAVLDSLNTQNAMTSLNDFVGSQMANNYAQALAQYNTDYNQGLTANAQNFNQTFQERQLNNLTDQNRFANQMDQARIANEAAQINSNAEFQRMQLNQMIAQQNYENAINQMRFENEANQSNFANYLNAYGLQNQALGQNFSNAMQGANLLQGLGTASQSAALKSSDAYQQLGNIITAQDQAQKENAYNYGYLDARNYPMDTYERLAGINAMQPVNRTSTTSQSGGWLGPAIGAVGSIMASDETAKEGVRDRDPEEVLGAFAQVRPKTYAYTDEARKALPETTADGERRGFLAQDYAKAFKRKNPVVGGYQHIDIPNVLGDLVAAVHGLEARTRKLKKKAH